MALTDGGTLGANDDVAAPDPTPDSSAPTPDVDAGDPVVGADAGDPFADVDGAVDPRYAAAPVCTSGLFWLPFDIPTDIMRPGETCISCHVSRGRGPIYTFAGTVYPTAHEPAECVGTGGVSGSPVQVDVTDATGLVVTAVANGSGNFYSTMPLMFPVHATVRYQGRELPMIGAIDNGDCNSCHTPDGASSAPGRIILP